MKHSTRTIFVICIAAYIILGLIVVYLADLQIGDENWHLAASNLVAKGLIPYRDFPYFHMPLIPYFYGIWAYLFGSDFIVMRCVSFIMGLLTVIFIYRTASRLKGEYAGILAMIPLVFNFNITYNLTYYWGPLQNFLISIFCLSLVSRLKEEFKYSLCVIVLVLIQGVSYLIDYITVYALLFITFVSFINKENKKIAIWMVLSYIGTSALIYAPWLILARKEFIFDTFTHYFSQSYVMNQGKEFIDGYTPIIYAYDRFKQVLFLFRNYYLVLLLLVFLAGYFFYRRDQILRSVKGHAVYLILGMLVGLSFMFYFGLFGHHLEHVPYHTFPAWAVLAGCLLAKTAEYFKTDKARSIFAATLLLTAALNLFTQDIEGYVSSPNYSDAKFVNAIAAALKRHTVPEEKVFAFTSAYVLQANRQIFPDTIFEVSGTSLFNTISDEDAKMYKLLSHNILLGYFKDKKAKFVVLKIPGRLNKAPSVLRNRIEKALSENYSIVEKVYKYPGRDIPEPVVYIYKAK